MKEAILIAKLVDRLASVNLFVVKVCLPVATFVWTLKTIIEVLVPVEMTVYWVLVMNL